MKKVITIFLLLSCYGASSQMMQASIGAGTTANRVKLYIRPTVAANGVLSTLQFNLAVDASINPVPTLHFVGTPSIGISWQIDPSYVEGGLRHYQILTTSTPTINIGAGVEVEVMELEFRNSAVNSGDVYLYTLGVPPGASEGGGLTGNALFYCSGVIESVEGQLYYARPGVIVQNENSYFNSPNPSFAFISGIVLPTKWLDFKVIRYGNDAVLKWKVAEDPETEKYVIERSTDGRNFFEIAQLIKSPEMDIEKEYQYTDSHMSQIPLPVIYYRIREINIRQHFSFSEVRKIEKYESGNGFKIYPNLVKDGFYMVMPASFPANKGYKVSIFNQGGQMVYNRKYPDNAIFESYVNLNGMYLKPGIYYVRIENNMGTPLQMPFIIAQ